jgi:LEA14-like dessication related protein
MKKMLLLPLLLLTACSLIVEKPDVTFKDVRIAALDAKGVTIDFLVAVDNRNSFDIVLNEYQYDLRLMALPLTRGKSMNSVKFYGKTTTDFLIPVSLTYSDVTEILKRRPGLEDIPYQLNADLVINTSLGDLHVPITKAGMLTIPARYRPRNLLNKLGDFIGNRVAN